MIIIALISFMTSLQGKHGLKKYDKDMVRRSEMKENAINCPLLEISIKQKYIKFEEFNALYERCDALVKRINALKNSVREL